MKNEDDQPLILVVDDDLKNLQVAGRTLEKSGYKISMTQSGKEAIEVAKEANPDLILLDIMMPDMD
ncbi:MAG: response regulator, partial [Bdellovibrionota bacterium]|nr:response regulator [Bdellovibrionota bacterium]